MESRCSCGPIFPLANTAVVVFAARLTDRIGKGIRGAPRDALVADVTPPEQRGAAYGLRQSLDSIGAFAGPLAALGLMLAFQNDIRRVFWVAALPAIIAVAIIVLAVREPEVHRSLPDRGRGATSAAATILVHRRGRSALYARAIQ